MRPFDHHLPSSLSEALELLAGRNGRACVIAGGSDLLKQMKAGQMAPEAVISIRRLPELQGISYDRSGLRLGAAVTLRELTRSPLVREHYPCLAYTASLMASEQIRSFATVGGNLCNASPAADLPPPLITLGAQVRLVSVAGERQLALEDFFVGPGQTVLRSDELLVEILVPPPDGRALYLRFTPRVRLDCAGVGVALWVHREEAVCRAARVALGAVAPVPMRARQAEGELTGRPLTEEVIGRAAAAAAAECAPIDDVRGSAWHRRQMVEVLMRRGLAALAREDG